MSRKSKIRKHTRRVEHRESQEAKLKSVLYEATHMSKKGGKLKKPREGKALVDAMESFGYTPNGRGGWRKMHKPRQLANIEKG